MKTDSIILYTEDGNKTRRISDFFAVIDGENNATEEVQVAIAPNNVLSVVAPMVNAVVDYQKQFNIDLGIKTPER